MLSEFEFERAAVRPLLSSMALAVMSLFPCAPAQAAEPAPADMPQVIIVATTPLPGVGLPREQIAGAVQTASARDIEKSGALDLSDFLNRSLASVHVNETQGNPLMMDVSYRGYTASPLLGTPQGLSVYMDGVRLNQPFGDVVLWDLIPKAAIASISLMSGANPLFGLNTLGGALSIRTKDGQSDAGTALEVSAGSFGRRSLSIEHGGSNEQGLDWFLTANAFRESGWRDDSPSRLGQFFGKLGWHDAQSSLKLSYAYAASKLNGNGLQEDKLLATDYASVFTKPDITRNHASLLNLEAQTRLSDTVQFSGNVYYRNTRTDTTNGDLNEDALGESLYYTGQAADKAWLAANGYGSPASESTAAKTSAAGAFPKWRCIAEAGLKSEPNEKCNGLITTTATHQENAGLSGQLAFLSHGQGYANQGVLGGAYDASRIAFLQSSQFGYLNADRSITPVNAFADGTQNSENAFDQRVDLAGRVRTWSLFGSDTLSLRDTWHVTLSGRYNETRLTNTDPLYPYNNATTQGEQRGSLAGEHRFSRFNPAVGVSFTPTHDINGYAGYSESSRAPTSIELGCADPQFGCRLPNSMAGDPALNQVVSKTWEAGVRGRAAYQTNWNLGVFRGDNFDDIMFVANTASTGYFKNFGKTRHQGVEAGISGVLERVSLGANYTWLMATYQSQDTLSSQNNSATDSNGAIAVHPGDLIPLIPRQIFKAHADYQILPNLTAGLQLIAIGNSYVRGNENNADVVNATHLGSGRVPGYSVFNFSASYKPAASWKLFANVSNVFDRAYATTGQLGPYAFTPAGGFNNSDSVSTSFYSPGAPRTFSLGARYVF